MGFEDELLMQLPDWLAVQDCMNKTESLTVMSELITRGICLSDAGTYCTLVKAPEDTVELYKRFLSYVQQQHEDSDTIASVAGDDDYLLGVVNEMNAKLDMILAILESRG